MVVVVSGSKMKHIEDGVLHGERFDLGCFMGGHQFRILLGK